MTAARSSAFRSLCASAMAITLKWPWYTFPTRRVMGDKGALAEAKMAKTDDSTSLPLLSTASPTLERLRAGCPTVAAAIPNWRVKRAGYTQSAATAGMRQPFYRSYLRARQGMGGRNRAGVKAEHRPSSPPLPAPTALCYPQNGCHLQQASQKHGGEIASWLLPFQHHPPCTLLQAPSLRLFNVHTPARPRLTQNW